jgi:hypothetical protein
MSTRMFKYTKDSGDISEREVIVISKPHPNYLCYDVSNLSEDEINYLTEVQERIAEHREACVLEYEHVTGKHLNKLFRSFKPGGIDWTD